ncbi:RHS repeat domain-containing protein [Algoriphagus chordae]|nr:RHS repeat-associated core domain-containing protein [Algoriphagus chordae]
MSTTPVIVQETHYDPWGLELTGLGYQYGGIKVNKYLYQGKEIMDDQNLNIYDFEARGYDPVIGRTWQLDPHGENYLKWSPYSWTGDNPVLNIDPDGMDWFVSNYNGVLINIQGQSDFKFTSLQEEYGNEIANFIYNLGGGASNDSWENFGADDMFDSEENQISGDLNSLTLMTEEASNQFMLDNGYHKALKQQVSELDITYQESVGIPKAEVMYGGNKKILDSRVTYSKLDDFGKFIKSTEETKSFMMKMVRTNYTQIIPYSMRRKLGSNIFSKESLDWENLGVNFYTEILLPLMKKRK